jgi:alcohol dehydrogenase YqhD (iron-dependent ADH family)
MENFVYYNPTKIEFGKEKEKKIGKFIKDAGIKLKIAIK